MPRNRHTVEQIITKLREAEVALSKGQPVPQACRTLGITEQTYYIQAGPRRARIGAGQTPGDRRVTVKKKPKETRSDVKEYSGRLCKCDR
jgi:transposase-like protein